MRWLVWLPLLIACGGHRVATVPPPAPAASADHVPFGPDERAGELAFLRNRLRETYAHLETKQQQWGVDLDALVARYDPKIRAADTWKKYELVMASFVAELHDGHVTWRRKRAATETKMKTSRLGLATTLVGDDLIVSEVWPGSGAERAGIALGDRIIAVDGRPIAERIASLATVRSWARLEAARYDFAQEWPASRYRADGVPKQRTLTRESAGATADVVVVPETKSRGPVKRIELAWRGDVAVLRVRELDGKVKETRQEAAQAATAIFARPAGLVLDLRGNGGGFENGARAIAAALTSRRVVGANTRVRLSARAREVAEWKSLAEDPAKPGWSTLQPLEAVGIAPREYGARIAVLIDAGCRSSCESLALLMRAVGARLIGETTGGSGGAPIAFVMPRSSARVKVPARASFDLNGRPIEGVGVTPDDTVAPTRADIANRRDVALERAVDHVCVQGPGRC